MKKIWKIFVGVIFLAVCSGCGIKKEQKKTIEDTKEKIYRECEMLADVIGDQLGHDLLSVHLDALEVGQMVQTVAFAVNAGRIHAVQVGKLVQHAARCVADTVGEVVAHIAQRLRNHACRICKVKYLDARLCQLFDQLAVFSQRRNRAHGERNAGRTCGLLTENTQIKRQPFIAHAGRIAADTDGRDDVIRIGYRLLRTGGQCELHRQEQQGDNPS